MLMIALQIYVNFMQIPNLSSWLNTFAVSVEVIVSDAWSLARPLVSGPRSTQPTFFTGTSSRVPIHSITAGVVDARCLTVFNTVCWIFLTPKNVSVVFFGPAIVTCTVSVEVIVSDAWSLARPLVSGPRSTQPAFLTGTSCWIPIHSITAGVVDAGCLTVFNTVCWIFLTPKNVSVVFFRPATCDNVDKIYDKIECVNVQPIVAPVCSTGARIFWENMKLFVTIEISVQESFE